MSLTAKRGLDLLAFDDRQGSGWSQYMLLFGT